MAEFIDTSKPFVAQQNFVCGGVAYTTGDLFPIDGLSWRELERLFRYRRIRNEFVEAAPQPASTPEPDPVVEAAEPVTTEAPEPEPAPTSTVELVDTGAGWYNVMLAGVVLNEGGKLKGRKAAEAWCKEQGYM